MKPVYSLLLRHTAAAAVEYDGGIYKIFRRTDDCRLDLGENRGDDRWVWIARDPSGAIIDDGWSSSLASALDVVDRWSRQ